MSHGYKGLKQCKIIKLPVQQVAMVVYKRGSPLRGSFCRALNGKIFCVLHRWSLMGGGRSREEVVHGGWPVIGFYRRGLSLLAQPPTWRPRGSHLGLVSTLRLFWHEWLYLPLMNVIASPKYHECEYPLCSCHQRPVLGRTNRLNDFVTLKYEHIV